MLLFWKTFVNNSATMLWGLEILLLKNIGKAILQPLNLSHSRGVSLRPQNMFFSIFGHKDNEKLLYSVQNR